MNNSKKSISIILLITYSIITLAANKLYASDAEIRNQIYYSESEKTSSSKISPIITRLQINTSRNYQEINPMLRIDRDEKIQVYIYLDYIDNQVLSELEENNFVIEIINTDLNIIQGWVSMDDMINISELDYVIKIKPPVYGILRQGTETTEGDMVLNSDMVRDKLGITGKGINVGVISNGIDSIDISKSTGDLPDNICIIKSGNGDEGTALLETIHDIAPEAELSFSEGFSSSLAFMKSIDDLINKCHVDIIVDDVGFLLEPYFQDGPVAQKVDEAVSKGIVYITAAGNSADEHYQHEYVDENTSDNELNIHDFGKASGSSSNLAMPLLVAGTQSAPNNFITVVLEWNDPMGMSNNDYDLYLFDENSNLLDKSDTTQNGNDDPIEAVQYINNTNQIKALNLVINRFSGDSKILELNFNGLISVEDYNVPEDSIFGHAAAQGSISVAAVPYFKPDTIEDYSSRGPVSLIAGNTKVLNKSDNFSVLKAFNEIVTREKPDITGVDGTSTSLTDFTPFFGTSVAAPHVAGVVALILEAAPGLTGSGTLSAKGQVETRTINDIESLRNILRDTSVDLGDPGYDTIYGYGRIDAFAAVNEAMSMFGGDGGNDGGMIEPPDNNNGNNSNSGSGGCNIANENLNIQSSLISLLIIMSTILSAVLIRKYLHNL